MCAKKKTTQHKTWKLAGEPMRCPSLSATEKGRIASEFSDNEFIIRQKLMPGCMTSNEAVVCEDAAVAISAYLCEHFADCHEREAVIASVATMAAVPIKVSAGTSKLPTFLMGAVLWLLDYLEETCEDPDEYLSLLPPEPDGVMEYRLPLAEDLEHSREAILRMLTVLAGRGGAYRKNFRSLLDMIKDDDAVRLRRLFKDALLDFVDRALNVCQLLNIAPWVPQSINVLNPPCSLNEFQDEHPSIRFLHMAHGLICRPVSVTRKKLHSLKAAELVSGYSTNDPYALCMAFFLLEAERDVLVNLNGLTSIVMICAMRHLPWSEDDLGARTGLYEPGMPDYKLQYIYGERPGEEGKRLESEWLLSEAQLFYIATGVVPPRKHMPSRELVRWFMEQGVVEQRARELAWGAMFACYSDAGERGWRDFDWRDDDEEDKETLPSEEPEEVSAAPDGTAIAERLEELTQQVKEMRSALHDAERTSNRLRGQLLEAERQTEINQTELAQLRDTLYRLQSSKDEPDVDSGQLVELPWQVKRRAVVFGGHDTWRKAIKPLLPGARFYDREMLPDLNAIRSADVVWLQVNALSHKYYYRIIDAARKNDIPVRYFGSASAKKCAVQFALDELAAGKRME